MKVSVVERLPLENAIEFLEKDGIDVTREQAELILEFLYELADIAVDQYPSKPT